MSGIRRLIILENDIITLANEITKNYKGRITLDSLQDYEDYLNTLQEIKQGETEKRWISKYNTLYWPNKRSIFNQKITNIYLFFFRLKQ